MLNDVNNWNKVKLKQWWSSELKNNHYKETNVLARNDKLLHSTAMNLFQLVFATTQRNLTSFLFATIYRANQSEKRK